MSESTVTERLRFEPVKNLNPRVLSPAQIAAYNEQGFLKSFRIYDDEEVIRNRAYFDGLLAKVQAAGADAYSINGYHVTCRGLYDIAIDPRILDLVEDITGPDIVCWGSHYFCKLPHDPKIVPWHQDASYWPFDRSKTVTVWLAIDDSDMGNGCMQVIPGTHTMGALPWEETTSAAVLNQELVGVERLGKPVPFEIPAGSISLHADMLAHGSEANNSGRRRCGLTMRYCPASVRAADGWNRMSVICRGSDPSGHWANNPRPEGDNPVPPQTYVNAR